MRGNMVVRILILHSTLVIQVKPETPTRRSTLDEDAEGIEHLRAFGVDAKKVLIGLNPGSSYGSAKRWLPERFAEVADRLIASSGGHVLIFGGPGEWALGEAIAERISSPNVSVLSGRTSVRQLMALIKRCKLFVAND